MTTPFAASASNGDRIPRAGAVPHGHGRGHLRGTASGRCLVLQGNDGRRRAALSAMPSIQSSMPPILKMMRAFCSSLTWPGVRSKVWGEAPAGRIWMTRAPRRRRCGGRCRPAGKWSRPAPVAFAAAADAGAGQSSRRARSQAARRKRRCFMVMVIVPESLLRVNLYARAMSYADIIMYNRMLQSEETHGKRNTT